MRSARLIDPHNSNNGSEHASYIDASTSCSTVSLRPRIFADTRSYVHSAGRNRHLSPRFTSRRDGSACRIHRDLDQTPPQLRRATPVQGQHALTLLCMSTKKLTFSPSICIVSLQTPTSSCGAHQAYPGNRVDLQHLSQHGKYLFPNPH